MSKLQVHVVVVFDRVCGDVIVDKIYKRRDHAERRVEKLKLLYCEYHSFGILKRSVQGIEDHGGILFNEVYE